MVHGGPSRPTHSKPPPWAVARRIRGRYAERQCPPDFEQIFITLGRLACEEHYSTRASVVTRWLDQCGKQRLIELRRQHVRQRRTEARIGKKQAAEVERLEARTIATLGIPDPLVAARAADHLRIARNGGWMISRNADGDWIVGLSVKSSAQLIAMATRYGFEPTVTLSGGDGFGVGSA